MGKHTLKKEKKSKNKFLIILILLLFAVLIYFGFNYQKITPIKKAVANNDETSIQENKKPVRLLSFKSNYETNKEKQIIYGFDNKDKVIQIKTIEKYNDLEQYIEQKEKYSQRKDIKIIENNDDELTIVYNKLDLSVDAELNYDQVKEKYLSIPGAYEVIE